MTEHSTPLEQQCKVVSIKSSTLQDATLPTGPTRHYLHSTSAEFQTALTSLEQQAGVLLTACQAACPRSASNLMGPPPLGDQIELSNWVTSVLDELLNAADTALDAHDKGAPLVTTQRVPALAGHARNQGKKKGVLLDAKLAVKPQALFDPPVDNSTAPFVHWAPHLENVPGAAQPAPPTAAAGTAAAAAAAAAPATDAAAGAAAVQADAAAPAAAAAAHPLQAALDGLTYLPWQLEAPEPTQPRPLDETPLHWVDTQETLQAMVTQLSQCTHVAIDLENHSYRSFQGFTCLMQVSSRTEDWVVDTLALRSALGPALKPLLANPDIVKVLHGADSDIVWLQRDYHLYVVNMFDTGQAARVLNMGPSLANLLNHYCQVTANKQYQMADWRVRPLAPELLDYARSDTHYLLYIYDRLKQDLSNTPLSTVVPNLLVPIPTHQQLPETPLSITLERSRRLCLTLYEKETLKETAAMDLTVRRQAGLNPMQVSVLRALMEWRDRVCREEDESTGYVLPQAPMIHLARNMPETAKDVIRIAGTGASDILRRHAPALAALIAAAKAQPAALPPTGADGPAAPGDTPAGSASAGVVGAASPVSLSALVPTSVPKIVRKGGLGAALKSHTTHTHTNTNTLSHTPNTTNTTHVNNTSHNSTVASDVATVATEAGSLRTSTGPHTTTTGAAADMRNGASDGVGETGGNGGVGEGSNGAMSPPLQVPQPVMQRKMSAFASALRRPPTTQPPPATNTTTHPTNPPHTDATHTNTATAATDVTNGMPATNGASNGVGVTADAHAAVAEQVRSSFSLPFLVAKETVSAVTAGQGVGKGSAAGGAGEATGGSEGAEVVNAEQDTQEPQKTSAADIRRMMDELRASNEDTGTDVVVLRPGAVATDTNTQDNEQRDEKGQEGATGAAKAGTSNRPEDVSEDDGFVPMSLSELKKQRQRMQRKQRHKQDANGGHRTDTNTDTKPTDKNMNKRTYVETAGEAGASDRAAAAAAAAQAPRRTGATGTGLFDSTDESGTSESETENEAAMEATIDNMQSDKKTAKKSAPGQKRARGADGDSDAEQRGGRGGRGPRGDARGGQRGGQRGGAGSSSSGNKRKPAFNPYDIPDDNLIKGGKRSAVMPRSGNKTMTFK